MHRNYESRHDGLTIVLATSGNRVVRKTRRALEFSRVWTGTSTIPPPRRQSKRDIFLRLCPSLHPSAYRQNTNSTSNATSRASCSMPTSGSGRRGERLMDGTCITKWSIPIPRPPRRRSRRRARPLQSRSAPIPNRASSPSTPIPRSAACRTWRGLPGNRSALEWTRSYKERKPRDRPSAKVQHLSLCRLQRALSTCSAADDGQRRDDSDCQRHARLRRRKR